MLTIHNSLTGKVEAFKPIVPGAVRMYVCGITVYDYCHIGHGRMLVAFDLVQRWLRYSGYRVNYVRNITDIDDKIIRRAAENARASTRLPRASSAQWIKTRPRWACRSQTMNRAPPGTFRTSSR